MDETCPKCGEMLFVPATPEAREIGDVPVWCQDEGCDYQTRLGDWLAAKEEENARLKAVVEKPRPTIACLCGSTRFMEAYFAAGWELTLMGQIVLSVGVCKHADEDNAHGAELAGVAEQLDELHRRKIDLADWVLILNVGGYYGESTIGEAKYAREQHKPIVMLFPKLVPRLHTHPHPDDYPSWDTIAAAAREAAEAEKGDSDE